MRELLIGLLIVCILPFLFYFCVKFGTVAFYKAKQYIEEEKKER